MQNQRKRMPEYMRTRKEREGYWCDFTVNGYRVRRFLSRDFEVAKRMLKELYTRAEQRSLGLLDNAVTIKELREKFMTYAKTTLRPATVRRYRTSMDAIVESMGMRKVSQLSFEVVSEFRQERLATGLTPRSVNIDVVTLNSMLNWAVEHKVIASNPIKGMRHLRHDHPRNRRALTVDEVQALLTTSKQPWTDMWYAFLTTGIRFGELASLRFSDVDWESKEIVIRSSVAKNGTQRRIPVDDHLLAIIRVAHDNRHKRKPGKGSTAHVTKKIEARFTKEHVFVTKASTPVSQRNLLRALRICCRKAGINTLELDADGREVSHVDLHSLRVTFATTAISSGVDPKTVQEILGHKTLEMTMKIYTKVHVHAKRRAVDKLPYGLGKAAAEPASVPFPSEVSRPLVAKVPGDAEPVKQAAS